MRQNYFFPAALAIIFMLKTTNWHWTKIAKTFPSKTGNLSLRFGNSILQHMNERSLIIGPSAINAE